MSRKNIKSIKDCLYKINKDNRPIQLLDFSTTFYESRENIITDRVSHIRTFAIALEPGMALSLSSFQKYCESQRDDFKRNEVITLQDFEAFSKYTVKACLGLGGLKKVIDGKLYFFATYRVVDNGLIFGEWIPFEENKEALGINVISKTEEAILKNLQSLRKALTVYEADKNSEKISEIKKAIGKCNEELKIFRPSKNSNK